MLANGQMRLPLGLRSGATLDDFCPEPNTAALNAVRSLLVRPAPVFVLYLYGPGGVGKSHLLQGAAQSDAGWIPYIECAEMMQSFVDLALQDTFSSLVDAPLVCLDNVDAWAGQVDQEKFLYDLYNERFHRARPLLLAGREASRQLVWTLPDWASRFSACVPMALQLPDDLQRLHILQTMAQRRGLRMDRDVARYVLRHQSRDMVVLESLLEMLDARSWEQQRQLTIPFIRHCLDREASS